MTRSQLALELIRAFAIVALGLWLLFMGAVWAAGTFGFEAASNILQLALYVSTIAVVIGALLQVVVGIPLWLIPKFRRSHG